MAELLRPDICVIGAGAGGLSVAAGAAAFGVPVVLVEQGRMGGDCLNTGCVPSKSLLAAATVAVGQDIEIKARRFVIATGSLPQSPPIQGLAATPHHTNETIFDLA